MKIRIAFMIVGILALGSWGYGQEAKELKDRKEKLSYVIGIDIGKALQKQGVPIDPDLVAKGIKDGVLGEKLLMSDQEIQETMMAFQKEMRAKQEEANKQIGGKEQEEGGNLLGAKQDQGRGENAPERAAV